MDLSMDAKGRPHTPSQWSSHRVRLKQKHKPQFCYKPNHTHMWQV